MPSPITIAPVITRQSQKKDGTFPVRIRITFRRKYKLLSTNLVARKDQLSRSLEITDRALAASVSSIVCRMRDAANTIDPFSLDGMDVAEVAMRIERALSRGDGPFSLDFPDYFEKIAAEKRTKELKANFLSALHALTAFVGSEHFDVSVITSSFMRKFERHLTEKHGAGARAVSLYTKTVACVHRRAREEFNNEEAGDVLIRNPFEYYHCPRQRQAPHRDVDREVIRKMLLLRGGLSGRERIGVDLFLISFALMGMNTPDIYECGRPKDGVISYRRTKTRDRRADGAEMRVRIEDCVAPFLGCYRDLGRERAFTFYHRYSTYQNLGRAANIGLAEFSKRIGVPGITIYSARHSFATLARQVGVDKATVDECLCHVGDFRMADVYIKRDWSILWAANQKVLSLFEWPR